MAKKSSNAAGNSGNSPRIELIDFSSDQERPKIAVYAVDRSGKAIEKSKVSSEGSFRLSDKAVKSAARIIVGPDTEKINDVDKKSLTILSPLQYNAIIEATGIINISKIDWYRWFNVKVCVSGSVSHCFPFPIVLNNLVKNYQIEQSKFISTKENVLNKTAVDAQIAYPLYPIFHHCDKICDGLVEVYRRTCCCYPIIIYDPRIPEIIKELENIVVQVPPIKWPPIPGPDPGPEFLPFFKEGALDQKAFHAGKDLIALRTLEPHLIPEYINARPYLFCTCGTTKKVAQGIIGVDGKFNICWYEPLRFLFPNCHDEYSFIVKQNFNGSTITIYNGVSANIWFKAGDFASLVSYSIFAQSCRSNDFPGEGAFSLLQDIGSTGSFRLKTPNASGWDRVASPVYNDGLAYPAATAADALGKYLNRNWGGTLKLRYFFSEPMKSVGAKYYRVSVVESDAFGNPTGERKYLAPSEWKYYEIIGTIIYVRSTALGPHSAGGQNHLYEIPYDADRIWQSGQYHALLDTTSYQDKRHLVMLEIFDSTGKLLRPTGTPNPGGSTEAAYTYRRWYQETGPTANVPFAALTHMFWWDNRHAHANIVDLRKDNVPSNAQCQFILGTDNSQFSIGYRAYHDQPMFLLDHRIWWKRGLGGSTGILTSPNPNHNNVGVPPGGPHQSGSDTFSHMLNGFSKCSFTVNLHSNVKTFNGIGTLDSLDGWDSAAFALEKS